MDRALLIARREYAENLRTKTFWVGIFSFPIVLVLAVALPLWLEQTKAPRRYAVLDRSGWFTRAVLAEADAEDLERVFRSLVERFRLGKSIPSVLPPALRGVVPDLAALPEGRLRVLAHRLADTPGDPAGTEPPPTSTASSRNGEPCSGSGGKA